MVSGVFDIHEIGGGWGWTYVSSRGIALSQSSRIYARRADAVRDALRAIGAFQTPRRQKPPVRARVTTRFAPRRAR